MKVLVVSPHPDDETLGAGGTISRLISEGHAVYWLNITTMEGNNFFSDVVKEKRKKQLEDITTFLKFTQVYHLNMPTTELEKVDSSKAIEMIGKVFTDIGPEMLILPDYNDVHSDHKIVFDWCYACAKIFRCPTIKHIMTMEIPSETDFGRPENPFVPNYYVDITDYIERKIEALKIYDTEIGEPPFPRSVENIKALAMLRGSVAGVRYAEAFRMIKYIL